MAEPSKEKRAEKQDKLLFDSSAIPIDLFGSPAAQKALEGILRAADRRARRQEPAAMRPLRRPSMYIGPCSLPIRWEYGPKPAEQPKTYNGPEEERLQC